MKIEKIQLTTYIPSTFFEPTKAYSQKLKETLGCYQTKYN